MRLQDWLEGAPAAARIVILSFDGMHLEKNLQYSRMKDDIIGHEDVGPTRTSKNISENLLMFMIKGLFGSWSEIIGHHFVPSSFSKEKLKECILEKLSALHNYGLLCGGIVCDQEPSHVSIFKSMGVTRSTPYIKCPFSNRPVYIFYDPPHLLKSTRNNFLNYNFMVCISEETYLYKFTLF